VSFLISYTFSDSLFSNFSNQNPKYSLYKRIKQANMFIDTRAANKNLSIHAKVTGAKPFPTHSNEGSPSLETFVGQDAPPPSYLEATTPMPWARSGGEEGERLLEDGGRSVAMTPMREEHKDGKYQRRGWMEYLTGRKRRVVPVLVGLITLIIMASLIATLARKQKQVRSLHIQHGTRRTTYTYS
jgi:hypothetical protein